MDAASLYRSPNALAPHYSRFRVSQRLLLTGHSHQAWPDCGFEAQSQAWLDAARYVDDKWEHAFQRAQQVREGFTRLLGDAGEGVALASNTHELVVRLLSALPLRDRPRLVTTDGEFHTIRRQLDRLAEEGLEVVRVAEQPVETVSHRLAAAVDGRTALVLVSAVFFDTGRIARGLREVAESCRQRGVALLVDAYHALNVVPFPLADEGLDDAFVVGGGYKYCQLGEGNCFLRLPPGTTLRPAVTGWYSEFTALTERGETGRVVYGQGGDRFAGATYDPTSHYRAAAVFQFFREQGLTPPLLREVSQHQIGVLASAFDALDLDPTAVTRDRSVPLGEIGGFLALRSPLAGALARELHARDVMTDTRGDVLRFGPAPYLSDVQLRDAMGVLGEILSERSR
ncbi:MAG TPA: aminotransferase class V-fold PLP-dependent enzyme [Gemmatimonadales bacterium]|jgi:selenocysteine lyase/cysteine desulfurase